MRVLITGSSGFIGRHLIAHLLKEQPDQTYFGTFWHSDDVPFAGRVNLRQINLSDAQAVHNLLAEVQPDQIYHLAAQSSAGRSIQAGWDTLETNIRGQFNLIESCIALGLSPRIAIASSAEIYQSTSPVQMPITEETPLRAQNPYGLSKITQDMMALQYHVSHKLPLLRIRAFNQIGPGQRTSFVAPDFATQIARIEAGLQTPQISVGNLAAKRDFTDIRDTVKAYAQIMAQGIAGEAYNIASNAPQSIQYLLDTLLAYSTVDVHVSVDPNKLRPIDVPIIQGDYAKLHALTGWQPTIRFEDTLRDVLDECRQRVKEETTRSK